MTYNTLSDDGNAAAMPPSTSAEHNPNEEIVTIATYQSIVEADLVRSELESRGISAFVSGATIAQTFISMPETGITIQVAASDAATAKQVADELASSLPASFGDGDDEADDYSDDDTESDTDLAAPSTASYDYGYDVDEDAEDAVQPRVPQQIPTFRANADPHSSASAAFQDAYPDPAAVPSRINESEVDIQRKPGMSQGQPMYDDAEAGG